MTTQSNRLGALAAIACYMVDSDDSDYEDMDVEEDRIVVASHIINVILNRVIGGDIKLEIKDEPLCIKEEPVDYEDIVVTPFIGWMTDSVGYRDPTTIKIEDDTEDSESDSDSSSSSDSTDDDEEPAKVVEEPKTSNQQIKSKNELGLGDLPPIEDLHITVPIEECVKIGTIASCVQELVVIESLPGNPALDLDSVLFLDFGKRTLGHIFDVIGPVNQPLYCVRFNSAQHIQQKAIEPGMSVFYAPKTEHTAYVFLDQLMKMKISDASWANDEEPPPNFLDYSDDEEEQKAKQERKLERMKSAGATDEEVAAKRARLMEGRNKKEAEGDRLPGAVGYSSSRGNHRGNRGHSKTNSGNREQSNANSVNREQSNANSGNREQINANSGNRGHNDSNSGNRGHNDSNSGNRGHNPRRGNGLYGENNNPFYRRSRTYDPKENGPIHWGSAMPAAMSPPAAALPNFATLPPQYSNATQPSQNTNASQPYQPPFGSPAAYPRQPRIYGQPNMYYQNHWQQPQQNHWQPQSQHQPQVQQPQVQQQQQPQRQGFRTRAPPPPPPGT